MPSDSTILLTFLKKIPWGACPGKSLISREIAHVCIQKAHPVFNLQYNLIFFVTVALELIYFPRSHKIDIAFLLKYGHVG
jgi:hypothetical protein